MNKTKQELQEEIKCLKHNLKVADERLERQYKFLIKFENERRSFNNKIDELYSINFEKENEKDENF